MKRSGGHCGPGEPVPWLYAAAVTLRWQMVAMEIQALVRYSDFLMKNSPILKFQASVLPFKYHRRSALAAVVIFGPRGIQFAVGAMESGSGFGPKGGNLPLPAVCYEEAKEALHREERIEPILLTVCHVHVSWLPPPALPPLPRTI